VHPLSRRLIQRTPTRLRRPVALGIRTGDAAIKDRLPGLAAEIAFWVLLSFPSLLLTAIAAGGVLLEGQDWQDQLIERAVEVARVALTPDTIETVVRPLLEQLVASSGLGIVSFAFVATVWTASRAVKVVLVALAIVYGREEQRQPWKDRLLGFGITIGALVVGIVLVPLFISGPAFGELLDEWIAADLQPLPQLWRALYWPTVVIFGTLALAVLYHLGVPGRTSWRRDLPGAVLATAVWLGGSAGLRLYGSYIAGTDSVYGPLAGPIVALLWLWLTGFAVLVGGELNAQTHRVFPPSTADASDERLLEDDPTEPPADREEGRTARDDTVVVATRPEGGESDPTLPIRTMRSAND
jgi:membrane protein